MDIQNSTFVIVISTKNAWLTEASSFIDIKLYDIHMR